MKFQAYHLVYFFCLIAGSLQADWVSITNSLSNASFGSLDVIDNIENSVNMTFQVECNSDHTNYDVWISVDSQYIDTTNNVYIAQKGTSRLPLQVNLTGNPDCCVVNADPAALQSGGQSTAEPHTGNTSDGDGVWGTDKSPGTTYTITLKEKNSLSSTYPDIPAGTYSLSLRANVGLD